MLPPLPPLPDHTILIVAVACAAVALLDFLLSRHLRKSKSMSTTLGDDFAAYLNADSAVNVAKAQLQASQTGLADATEQFHQDLTTSGVRALLAPSTTPGGDTPVALVGDDGSITIIVAASPNTPVGPVPAPAPAPTPAPVPTPTPTPVVGN